MSIITSILLVLTLFTVLGIIAFSTVAKLLASPAASRPSVLDAPIVARETVAQFAS